MNELQTFQLKTPFKHSVEIHDVLRTDLRKIKVNDVHLTESEIEEKLRFLCSWLCTTPKNTYFRVNTLNMTVERASQLIKSQTEQDTKLPAVISLNPNIPDLVILHNWDKQINLDLERYSNEVIVDAACGSAVLRGAHIFAPGVIGMPHGLVVGDKVSVFADIVGQCKKGLVKKYDENNKVFLGNGIVKQTREHLFTNNDVISGIAVQMTDVVSRIPQINDSAYFRGNVLLQNLPSIICTHVLNPQPGETILDMCAAPGNKTTHISLLMNRKGVLIALEKIKSKLEQLKRNCDEFLADNVKLFCYDSTKAVCDKESRLVSDGPPFGENSFDRILLDGPCSALGQRPQLLNSITAPQLQSYVPLQRKLFSAAVRLLKPNGILIYSTCTVTIMENEGIVSWALKTFPCLRLKSVKEQFQIDGYGTSGYSIDGLTQEQAEALRRFGPETDTVGFFIACFIKLVSLV